MLLLYVSAGSFFISTAIAHLVHLYLNERIALLGDFFGMQKSYNPGIAFGVHLGVYQTMTISLALCLVLYMAITSAKTKTEQWGYGLILGGGFANVLDRMVDGVVTDMIQVGAFPIFNIADTFINIGVGLLLLSIVLKKRPEARNQEMRKKT